jgi:hypothetical protein
MAAADLDWQSKKEVNWMVVYPCRGIAIEMTLGIVANRLAALFVLLASFADYWAYDQWGPAAPMNSSGPEAIAALKLHGPSSASVQCANLADDNCACCSPLMAPPAPVVPQPALHVQAVTEFPSPVVSAALKPSISASPPWQEPTGFDRPLRT